MAFSATVRKQAVLGDGLVMTMGDWSGLAGDAAGTLVVSGGYPLLIIFQKYDAATNTQQIIPSVSVSVSGSLTTITVENQDAVTTGRFVVIHGGK